MATKLCAACHYDDPIVHAGLDCMKAIKMIPSGKYEFDVDHLAKSTPDPAKPISLVLNNRKYLLPAAFIRVQLQQRPVDGPRPPPRLPVKAASAMTFIIWPNVRKLAEGVVNLCARNWRTSCFVWTASMLGDWNFHYSVRVHKIPYPAILRNFTSIMIPVLGNSSTVRMSNLLRKIRISTGRCSLEGQ